MPLENIPCVHDYLDPNTTVVVSPFRKMTWCISCSKARALTPLNDASRIAAIAAYEHMLFGGGSRGDN